jgi:hypothetical protein
MASIKFSPELIAQIESMFNAKYTEVLTKQSTIEPYLKPSLVAEYQRIDMLWTEFRQKVK